jgi:hypothetical protein
MLGRVGPYFSPQGMDDTQLGMDNNIKHIRTWKQPALVKYLVHF